MVKVKEKFIPVQIDQELCMKCERCVRACKNDAIYFEHSIRKVDYEKCVGCLACQLVCPRNAIQVTSVEPKEIISIKIDHELCTMCGACLVNEGRFCPNNLFYIDKVKKKNGEVEGIRFKFREIAKCQGCLKCQKSCPEGAIQPIQYNPKD
ncbi:MAG: 4Fe-4S dicluster domain-containing protein [Promethearchaeota archaeon]|nr:MAG: 4Fe-4S dicluster domain-containing protein [Candidatus Lokiarchaeota archaeon]